MEKKTPGVLSRKIGEQFFKDCFELYAMRQNKKMKDYKVDVKKAAASSFLKMSGGGYDKKMKNTNMRQTFINAILILMIRQTINFQQFQEYINCYAIEEALSDFLGMLLPLSLY